jgi:hypothetical protein
MALSVSFHVSPLTLTISSVQAVPKAAIASSSLSRIPAASSCPTSSVRLRQLFHESASRKHRLYIRLIRWAVLVEPVPRSLYGFSLWRFFCRQKLLSVVFLIANRTDFGKDERPLLGASKLSARDFGRMDIEQRNILPAPNLAGVLDPVVSLRSKASAMYWVGE